MQNVKSRSVESRFTYEHVGTVDEDFAIVGHLVVCFFKVLNGEFAKRTEFDRGKRAFPSFVHVEKTLCVVDQVHMLHFFSDFG